MVSGSNGKIGGDLCFAGFTFIQQVPRPRRARIEHSPGALPPDQFDGWLDGSAGKEVLKPAPEHMLRKWPVPQRIDLSRTPGDDPTLIEPVKLALRLAAKAYA